MGLVTSDDICFVLLNLLFYDNEGDAVTYNEAFDFLRSEERCVWQRRIKLFSVVNNYRQRHIIFYFHAGKDVQKLLCIHLVSIMFTSSTSCNIHKNPIFHQFLASFPESRIEFFQYAFWG